RSTEKLCPSRNRLARRRLGHAASSAISRRCAAARQARSLSAAESTTMSPGVWPRSIAAAPSLTVPGIAAKRCIAPSRRNRGGKRRGDRRAFEAFAPDDHKAREALFLRAPGPVEILLDARSDGLDHMPERFVRHIEKAFEAKNVMRLHHARQSQA